MYCPRCQQTEKVGGWRGDGHGWGSGDGHGWGSGYGRGWGYGRGRGYGYGNGFGTGVALGLGTAAIVGATAQPTYVVERSPIIVGYDAFGNPIYRDGGTEAKGRDGGYARKRSTVKKAVQKTGKAKVAGTKRKTKKL